MKTMLTALRSPDLRKKLAFTAFILLIFRFGSFVPVPGVDLDSLQAAIDARGSRLLDFLNLFAS
jgi:preprotein translocase subunit SecY